MMLDVDIQLQHRFGENRPGWQLIAIENAALPVTVVGADVLAQERKPIPLLDEFVLRLVDAELTSVTDISAFLGLESRLVEATIADQVRSNNLMIHAGRGTLFLTLLGKLAVEDAEAVLPKQKQLQITFDRITWKAADYQRNELMTKAEARQSRMLLLPAAKTSRISTDDLTASAINALLADKSMDGHAKFEVLSVRKVRPHTHRYLPVKLLVYADEERAEIQYTVCVNEELSQPHELALNALGGAAKLGLHLLAPVPRPRLSEDLESIRVSLSEITDIKASANDRPESQSAKPKGRYKVLGEITKRLEGLQAVALAAFSHREVLQDALLGSHRRLLIASTTATLSVLDATFLNRIQSLAHAGVDIDLIYVSSPDEHMLAAELARLVDRCNDYLVVTRVAQLDQNVLVYDDVIVSSNFEWLSFQGSWERGFRIDEGTVIRRSDVADEEYDKYIDIANEATEQSIM